MRVISGKYKGKKLEGFDIVGTRATMDRVKESLFAMIQNYVKDSIVLDLFAGTGSLGIEALSNGAKLCYFVDKNPIAIKTIKNNTKDMDAIIIKDDFAEALKYFYDNNITFSLIILDPPYHENLLNKSLELIYKYNLLQSDGIIVCEYEEGDIVSNFNLIKEKKYGDKKIKILN